MSPSLCLFIEGVPDISVASYGKFVLQLLSLVVWLVTCCPPFHVLKSPGPLGGLGERESPSEAFMGVNNEEKMGSKCSISLKISFSYGDSFKIIILPIGSVSNSLSSS